MSRTSPLTVACLALCLALAGCGGRAARPVAVTQSFDKDMTCAQIALEVDATGRAARPPQPASTRQSARQARISGRVPAMR